MYALSSQNKKINQFAKGKHIMIETIKFVIEICVLLFVLKIFLDIAKDIK